MKTPKTDAVRRAIKRPTITENALLEEMGKIEADFIEAKKALFNATCLDDDSDAVSEVLRSVIDRMRRDEIQLRKDKRRIDYLCRADSHAAGSIFIRSTKGKLRTAIDEAMEIDLTEKTRRKMERPRKDTK